MHKLPWILFVLSMLFLNTVAYSNELNPWSLLASNDVKAMHKILEEDSPATVPSYGTKDFNVWFDSGYAQALKKAQSVTSYEGYRASLQFYASGFESEHLGINFLTTLPHRSWPGFLVSLRDNQYVVIYRESDPHLPPLGAILLSCDGQSPDTLMKQNILPYAPSGLALAKNIPATWVTAIPYLFIDNDNPWAKQPLSCVFKLKQHKQDYSLNWHYLGKASDAVNTILTHPDHPFTIQTFNNHGIWISIPVFNPDHTSDQGDFLKKIIAQIVTYRNKSVIVFDLRGNGGGNSDYSHNLMRNLYGDDYIASLGKNHIWNTPWQIGIRVSTDNIKMLQEQQDQERLEKIYAAQKKGELIARYPINIMPPSRQISNSVTNPVHAKVILLTDGYCGSTCWQFVRDMLQIPAVVQVGQATHFMTPYTQPMPITLPSGIAVFIVPTQVYLSPRDHFGQPFIPSYVYPGNMNDTPALQQWLIGLIHTKKL